MTVYFIKVSIITGVMYSFYRFLFYGTTFHILNRFYLLFIIPCSLIFPFLEHLNFFNRPLINNSVWINEFQQIPYGDLIAGASPAAMHVFNLSSVTATIYVAGAFVFLFRFLFALSKIIKLRLQSGQSSYGLITLIRKSSYNAPFSFFNWIFIPAIYTGIENSDAVLEHEVIHSKQLHSLDLIITELYYIAFWFNPFVFLIKKSLKSTHEYLADSKVIRKNISLSDYLKLLAVGNEMSCLSGITNHLKQVLIKKRIEMITKNKTSKLRKLLYLLIVPVIALLIQAFATNNYENNPPEIRPVDGGQITMKFGFEDQHPITKKNFIHSGVDIKAPSGTKVVSAAAGEVIEATHEEGWGNFIVIKHDDTYETWYAHLNDFTVQKGDKVTLGQVIGHVGNSGYSTGPHLHYEVRKNGEKVNPEEYFK